MNTNRRSICTGCVFCPNTLADSNDPRIAKSSEEIEVSLASLMRNNGISDLSDVQQINLSTGCFGEEFPALEHLRLMHGLLLRFGFRGRLGILSSVITSDKAMRELARIKQFALFLTLECITRRELLLKESKARLTAAEAIRVLARAREAGLDTGAMIVIGLDPLNPVITWIKNATHYLTDFPNLQVFQSHNAYMDIFRVAGAESIEFFLEARRRLEATLVPTSLRPRSWQNYRPLWYTRFATELLPFSQ